MSLSSNDSNQEPSTMAKSHSLVAKVMHWGFIGVFLYAVVTQVDEVEELEDVTLLVREVIFAVAFLVLLLGRYVYMRFTQPTVLPSDTPNAVMYLAKAVHFGMYVSLAMLAVTGLMIGGLFWSGIKDGLLMKATLGFHEFCFWASVNLMLLHIAGAVYHRLKGDGIWSAMVPFWKEGSE